MFKSKLNKRHTIAAKFQPYAKFTLTSLRQRKQNRFYVSIVTDSMAKKRKSRELPDISVFFSYKKYTCRHKQKNPNKI